MSAKPETNPHLRGPLKHEKEYDYMVSLKPHRKWNSVMNF